MEKANECTPPENLDFYVIKCKVCQILKCGLFNEVDLEFTFVNSEPNFSYLKDKQQSINFGVGPVY